MKDKSEIARFMPSASEKFLKVLDRRVSIKTALDEEIDQVRFHVSADGDSAIISFNNFSDAKALFKKYKFIASNNSEQVTLISRILSKIGLMICYQNRHFGFIGQNANLVLSKIFSFSTSFKKKSKAFQL